MDVEVEAPHQHHPTGHKWLDKVLPVSALLVSFISIWIAYHHGEVMQELVNQNERLVQANSLPHLQLYGSNIGPNGQESVSLAVGNAGIGPAEIRSVQILVDGRPVRNAAELVRACCGEPRPNGITTSSLAGLMVRPGQDVPYFYSAVTPANRAWTERFEQARRDDRIVTRICYCSVFDECWTRATNDEDRRPKPVEACPAAALQYQE